MADPGSSAGGVRVFVLWMLQGSLITREENE